MSPGAAAAAAKLAAWQPPRQRASSAAERVRAAFHRKEKIRALSRILVVKRKLRLRRKIAVRSPLLAPQSFVCRVDAAPGSWHAREVWIEMKQDQIMVHAKRAKTKKPAAGATAIVGERGPARLCLGLDSVFELSRVPIAMSAADAREKGERSIAFLDKRGGLLLHLVVPQSDGAAALAGMYFDTLAKLLCAVHSDAEHVRVTALPAAAGAEGSALQEEARAGGGARATARPRHARARRATKLAWQGKRKASVWGGAATMSAALAAAFSKSAVLEPGTASSERCSRGVACSISVKLMASPSV